MNYGFKIAALCLSLTAYADGSHTSEKGSAGSEESALEGVGPDKGIVAADEHSGFMPSEEVRKNFGIEHISLSSEGPWTISSAAVLYSLEERNVFRVRDGFYKRVDFTEVKKVGQSLSIISKDLRAGDQIASSGIGFLRAIELTVFSSEPAGHSH